jgi:hypothetical protein
MRKILLCLGVVLGFVGSGFGQDFEWANGIGGSLYDNSNSIHVDASGNVYTTGSFRDTVDFDPGPGISNLTAVGNSDIFIQKLDSSGNLVWVREMGGLGFAIGYSITTDDSGNVYSSGYFQGTVDFDPGTAISNLTSVGDYDIYVQKLDDNGNFLWAKSFGGALDDIYPSINLDSTGNLYIAGQYKDTVDFDPGTGTFILSSVGEFDIFVLKMDNSGNFLWAKTMGGIGNDRGTSLVIDVFGNIYTLGWFNGIYHDTVDFDPGAGIFNLTSSSAGYSDIFVHKMDASGNFLWVKAIGGKWNDVGNSIITDALGNVYSTGYFYDTVDFDPGPATFNLTAVGGYDIYIQKLDGAGNFLWAKSMGGTGGDIGYSINVDTSGNVYTTGQFQNTTDFDPGIGVFNLTSAGQNDIFVQKLDISGNLLWAKGIGGISSENGFSIHVDASDNVYITGSFQDTVDFDPSSGVSNFTSIGATDIFILKLSQSTATPITKVPYNTLDINIYPNPTKGKINLELGELKGVSIKVHSIDGQLIYSKENINEAVHVFDIREAAAGVYVVEVEAEEGKMHYKLVKQ